jgi:hypothetical protein
MSSKYKCKCGNTSFNLVDMWVQGSLGRRREAVLNCVDCDEDHYISPCNTNGLIKEEKEK